MALRAIVDRLLEHPVVYGTWQAPFAASKFAPISRHLAAHPARRVLDVGCGPGTNASRFAEAEYIGVDINEDYLTVARTRYAGTFVQADLATADLSSLGTFDCIVINSFLHHLADDAVHRILRQVNQLLEPEGRVHILELVIPDRASLSRMMARLDRGRYPRPIDAWKRLFEAHLATVQLEPYMLGGRLWAMVYFQGVSKRCVSP
jgi:SAM-dependent methyltransferase